ncbi:hypothetical protein EJB05_48782, partial [Eragrostis curvula]
MAESPPSRKPRVDAAADALASLPLDVLDNIFSRLHIYDVVRTSVLSRAWRRRWESLPSVDLNSSHGISASDVDALLLRRSAPVRSFRLVARDTSWPESAFHDWLLYLSRRGVRELLLDFPHRLGTIRLHSSVFSCRELTSLSLIKCCIRLAPAGFRGLPNLKTLHLKKVAIEGVSVQEHAGTVLEALIAASPLLEELILTALGFIDDNSDNDWTIRAPNLRKVRIASCFDYGGRTENLPLLKEAGLYGPNDAKFLTGMAGVAKLEFYCNIISPTEVNVLEQLPFLFENLRSLFIGVNFCRVSHISSMFCLLRSAPVLEELDVLGSSDGTQEIEANNEFLNAQCVGHMFTKLHTVRMKNIKYRSNEMHFMEFVLSKVKALQLLSISPCAPYDKKEAVNEVKEYPRASPDAHVVFMRRCSEYANDTSTKNSEVIGTDEARPRRRHRLDFESVAQVEQLQEEVLKLKNVRELGLMDKLRRLATTTREYREFREYINSAMQLIREQHNINQSKISQLRGCSTALPSDHPVTLEPGAALMNTVIGGAESSRASSPED